MPVSGLTKVGIAKEASWGTTTAPDVLIPVNPPSFTDNFETILDQAMRGIAAMDFASYQGVQTVEASLEGFAYPKEIGYFIKGILGAESVSGAGPYDHEFTLATTPPSFSVQDENGVQPYRYTGMMVGELGFTFNAAEGALEFSASLTGKTKESVGSSIPADATSAPFRGWMMCSQIAGGNVEVMEGELTLSRELGLVYAGSTCSGGSQYAIREYAGPLEVTGGITLDFTADSQVDRYENKTQNKLELNFQYGTGASQKTLKFEMNNCDYGDSPIELDRSGVHVTLAYTLRALYNSTDSGPAKVTLSNAKSDAY